MINLKNIFVIFVFIFYDWTRGVKGYEAFNMNYTVTGTGL
jgi:hypothetical protein